MNRNITPLAALLAAMALAGCTETLGGLQRQADEALQAAQSAIAGRQADAKRPQAWEDRANAYIAWTNRERDLLERVQAMHRDQNKPWRTGSTKVRLVDRTQSNRTAWVTIVQGWSSAIPRDAIAARHVSVADAMHAMAAYAVQRSAVEPTSIVLHVDEHDAASTAWMRASIDEVLRAMTPIGATPMNVLVQPLSERDPVGPSVGFTSSSTVSDRLL